MSLIDNRMDQRVLSIQSHVVHGYVGNKAAVFPLQLLGFDVDIVNSVHFSNHTGYSNGFEGDVLDGDQLKTILAGLKRNGLLENVGHILTGYIGKESFLRAVLDVLKTLRDRSEGSVRYVCDPVLGDSGKFYVPQELVSIYRNEVIPMADVVTPNQFEVEQLTGISVGNMTDAKMACRKFHDMGPELVVITSLVFDDGRVRAGDKGDETITILASSRVKGKTGEHEEELWSIDSPIIPGCFTGTGDLCAALLLGWTARESNNLPVVMQKVMSTMYCTIKSTWEQSKNLTSRNNELRIIQCKKVIEDPPTLFEAKRIV